MLVDSALSIVDVGYDYLTCTDKKRAGASSLYEVGLLLLGKQEAKGNKESKWRGLGYHGKRSGGVAVGVGQQGCILRLSGAAASAHTAESIPHATNVSRIDLQITCFDTIQQAERAHLAYHSMLEAPRRRGRPPSANLRLNSEGGQTLYVGARTSDRVGRYYDYGVAHKIAQAGAYWRLEVEYKRQEALHLAKLSAEAKLDDALIAAFVVDYFVNRGIPAPANMEDLAAVIDGHRATLNKAEVSDADKALQWLFQSVRGSVQRLVQSGRLADVISALGLGEVEGLVPSRPAQPNILQFNIEGKEGTHGTTRQASSERARTATDESFHARSQEIESQQASDLAGRSRSRR
jgi:DNA relaxase NicK